MSSFSQGIDIISLSRVQTALERTPSLLNRVFTAEEIAYAKAKSKSKPHIHLAAAWAAREAFYKAIDAGSFDYKDVSVHHSNSGRPSLVLSARAQSVLSKRGFNQSKVSLSHSDDNAIASVLLIGPEAVPAQNISEKAANEAEVLAKFREMKPIIE